MATIFVGTETLSRLSIFRSMALTLNAIDSAGVSSELRMAEPYYLFIHICNSVNACIQVECLVETLAVPSYSFRLQNLAKI